MKHLSCMDNKTDTGILDNFLVEDKDDFHKLLIRIHEIKSICVNNKQYCITNLPKDLEWLEKTICFTKSYSDYLVFSNGSSCALSFDNKLSPDNTQTPTLVPSSGVLAISMQTCPLDISENNQTVTTENAPFMKYKESVKTKYSMLIHVLKELYNTALKIPDVEKVRTTILNDFHINSDIYLKHPEFIMDDFFYHIYNHVNITEKYEKVLDILKVFEYIYYKLINYVNELEFDAETIKPIFEIY